MIDAPTWTADYGFDPKYVVSATLTTATWMNSKIIGPYDADAIRSLKTEVDGDLYVSGEPNRTRSVRISLYGLHNR